MRSNILRNYRKIISVAVENCDEHVVEHIVSNAEYINSKYQDPILIIFVWSDCFFSELFRNQRKAEDLFTAYDAIPKAVTKQISAIALQLICTHNIDAIHRLIEVLLKKDDAHKIEVNVLLLRLFDYHCEYCVILTRFKGKISILNFLSLSDWRHDLKACSEVMNTCLQLQMPISNVQNQKLLNLLLKNKPTPHSNEVKPRKATRSRFEFEF